MKKVLFSFLLLAVGFCGKVQASGWVTFFTTGVFLSSGAGEELLRVDVSSGPTVPGGSSYVVCADTLIPNTPINNVLNATGTVFSNFGKQEWLFPPLVLQSSSPASLTPQLGSLNLQDLNGDGRIINNGLACFIQGTGTTGAATANGDSGFTVTVSYRRRRATAAER